MDALEDLFFFSLTQDEKKEGGKKKYKTQTEQRVVDIAAFP